MNLNDAAQLLFALHTQCVMESPGTYWQDPQVETVLLTQWRSTTCAHRGGQQQKYRISNFCCCAPLWLKEMRVGYGTRKQATPVGTWINKRNGTELKRTKHTGKKRLGNKNEDVSWPKEMSWQMDWRVRATIFCTGFFLHSSLSSTFHFSPLHSTPAWFIPLDSFFLLSSFFFLFFWLGAVRNISANSWSTWKRFVSSNCLTWFSKAFWCQFLWSSTKLFDVQKFSDYSDFPTFRQTVKNFKTIHFLLCYYTFDYACIGEPMMAKFCLLLCYFSFDYPCIGPGTSWLKLLMHWLAALIFHIRIGCFGCFALAALHCFDGPQHSASIACRNPCTSCWVSSRADRCLREIYVKFFLRCCAHAEQVRKNFTEISERGVRTPLLQLWEASYVTCCGVLVLPLEAATQIAESHPDGYHSGVWHLATEYETLLAKALLTNSSPNKPGYQQPKSFSAWPRCHSVQLYREAAALRAALPENFEDIDPADVERYCSLILQWHQSTSYIRSISGHTRLDRHQLQQLCIALSRRHWDSLNSHCTFCTVIAQSF